MRVKVACEQVSARTIRQVVVVIALCLSRLAVCREMDLFAVVVENEWQLAAVVIAFNSNCMNHLCEFSVYF